MKPIVTKQLLMAWHSQQAEFSERDLVSERDAIARQRLIHKMEWHRSAVRILERENERVRATSAQ